MEIPVYLVTGFLNGGKTTFIKRCFEEGKLGVGGGPTLLLLCEAGQEPYPEDFLSQYQVYCVRLREQREYTATYVEALRKQHGCARVVIELNGFWPCGLVEREMPEDWRLVEKVVCADARTFPVYNSNLKGQTGDKISYASQVVFRQMGAGEDPEELHKLVRVHSRRARVFFLLPDSSCREYEGEEEPPFPLGDQPADVPDAAFGLWMHDLLWRPECYLGHTLRIRGQIRMWAGKAIFGRCVTTGSVRDAEFWGLAVCGGASFPMEENTWYMITARVEDGAEEGNEPVLRLLRADRSYSPAQPVCILR